LKPVFYAGDSKAIANFLFPPRMILSHSGGFTHLLKLILNLNIWRDRRGQDLIEYALMAGFVAVAAGAIMPGVADSISQIFSKVASVLTAANAS
jgi:pilus assembly protein Flp/PilA